MFRAMLVGCSVVLLACGAPTGPGGLRLELSASRSTLAHGDTVMFTMTVRNTSLASVPLTGSGSCTFRWQLDEVHQVIACTDDLRDWTFAPREVRTFVFPWNGFLRDIEGQPVPATPGRYTIRGILDAVEGDGRTDPVVVTITTP